MILASIAGSPTGFQVLHGVVIDVGDAPKLRRVGQRVNIQPGKDVGAVIAVRVRLTRQFGATDCAIAVVPAAAEPDILSKAK